MWPQQNFQASNNKITLFSFKANQKVPDVHKKPKTSSQMVSQNLSIFTCINTYASVIY